MIFKVQRPLGGSSLEFALVYNRDRSREAFVPYAELQVLFDVQSDPPPLKLYVEGELIVGAFRVFKIVPAQDW